MKNDGTEAHMIVLAAVEDDFDVQALIDASRGWEVTSNLRLA